MGNAKTKFDDLPVVKGQKLKDLSSTELCQWLLSKNVPGASAENGRSVNAQAYATFLDKIKTDASSKAVKNWLAS